MFTWIAIYISHFSLATEGLNLTLAFVYFSFNCYKLYCYKLYVMNFMARVMTTDMSKIFEAKFQAKHYLN